MRYWKWPPVLLAACSVASAWAEPLYFAEQRDGVMHSLRLDQLKVSAKGVPSFGYTYAQEKKGCRYAIAGTAVAGHGEVDGTMFFETFYPDNVDGKAAQTMLSYHDGTVYFALVRQDAMAPKSITIAAELNTAGRARTCDKTPTRISITFNKPVEP